MKRITKLSKLKNEEKKNEEIKCQQNLAFHFAKEHENNRHEQHNITLESICSKSNENSDNQVECSLNSLLDENCFVSSLN